MPNKDNLRLWVAALRSGEFEQGNAALTTINDDGTFKHCCLGVACQVALRHGVELDVVPTEILRAGARVKVLRYDRSESYLPPPVITWLGVDSSDPEVAREIEESDTFKRKVGAAIANDDLGWDFAQIANSVEEYYELNEEGEPTDGESGQS